MSEHTHRRRFSSSSPVTSPDFSASSVQSTGSSTAFPAERGRVGNSLSTISGPPNRQMSFSQSPSPHVDGGWSTPGLTTRVTTPDGLTRTIGASKSYGKLSGSGPTWASPPAQSRSAQVHAYSVSPVRSNGFLRRNLRNLSASLPHFYLPQSKDYSDREKLGRGRWKVKIQNIIVMLWRLAWKLRLLLLLLAMYILAMTIWYKTPLHAIYRRNPHFGGGGKFTMILGANPGGGVMEWKGPREWATERDSVRNKKRYAKRHGYNLQIIDMATKKRYAHEWRESWEKVDTIRRIMKEYPESEWFWWLDLNTFIMEPSYTLQKQIFNDLASNTYRDINQFNPLNISHPFTDPWLDPLSLSLRGDDNPASIHLIVPQDCSGFNLGSFFVRRSEWTDRLLDIWWDPVHYEQRHMQWEHKEQDALEYLYTTHPWIRSHTAFLPQRKAGSLPPGACGKDNPSLHYQEKDRDFMMSMAGCEWGRDCWGEMYTFRELSNKLNRTYWEKFKDGISDGFKRVKKHVWDSPKPAAENDKKT